VQWERGSAADFDVAELEREPAPGAAFAELSPAALKAKNFDVWRQAFATWLFGSHQVELLKATALDELSMVGESERDFRLRLQQVLRERRDRDVDRIRQKYAPKIATLQERLRRATEAEQREATQASQQKLQTAISFGVTLLGAVLGRKAVSTATLGRAATAARGVGRTMKEAEDVKRAGTNVAAIQGQIDELDAQLHEELAAIEASYAPSAVSVERVTVRPKKSGIAVDLVALAWVPRG
jgi:hypothetical protein